MVDQPRRRCRGGLAADLTLVYRPETHGQAVPTHAAGGFTTNAFDEYTDDQGGVHTQIPVNVEGYVQCNVTDTFRIAADGGWGNNAVQTMLPDQRFSLFGFTDAYLELRPRIIGDTRVTLFVGRRSDTGGWGQGVWARSNFIPHYAPSFTVSPFTLSGAGVGVENADVTARVSLFRRLDGAWFGDNNNAYGVAGFFSAVLSSTVTATANIQAIPDRDDDTDHWRIQVDATLLWSPSERLKFGAYLLRGEEDYISDRGVLSTRTWWAPEAFFNIQPEGIPSRMHLVGMFGYLSDTGARTAVVRRTAHGVEAQDDVRLASWMVGATMDMGRGFESRISVGGQHCFSSTCGFPTGSSLFTGTAQLVWHMPL